MKNRHHILSTALLSVLFVLMEGCTHKDLNEDAHTTIADNVEVIFDWSKAPDKEAKTMVLYLYPDGRDMMEYGFNNPDGGLIRTYAGKHTAVSHSNDDPYCHHLRNHHSHDEIEIFTDETAVLVGQGISTMRIPRAKGTEDEPLRSTPSMIYGAQTKDIELRATTFSQKLVISPEELICRYIVEFLDVTNLKNADTRIDATLSSLAGGYYPGRMEPTSEAVSHTFTLSADVEKQSLRAEFYTFGVPAGEDKPHKLCLYIAMKDRTGSFYTFDVSDAVNQAPDPRNVLIKIYGLKLPDLPDDPPAPPQGEGGITIEVDTWETYHYDLKV